MGQTTRHYCHISNGRPFVIFSSHLFTIFWRFSLLHFSLSLCKWMYLTQKPPQMFIIGFVPLEQTVAHIKGNEKRDT